jgi:hypothetical protein
VREVFSSELPVAPITIGLLIIVLAATPAVSRSQDLPTPATGALSTAEPVFDAALVFNEQVRP